MHARAGKSGRPGDGIWIRPGLGLAIEPQGPLEEFLRAFFLASLILLSGIQDRESRRFLFSWEQGLDDSCGLQALACLLSLYWSDPVDEVGLALGLGEGGSRTQAGVSLGDLGRLAASRGYLWEAYQLELAELEAAVDLYPPVLVHYDRPQGHFALVLARATKGEVAGAFVVADPATGLQVLAREDFLRRWSGKALLLGKPREAVSPAVPSPALGLAVQAALGPMRLLGPRPWKGLGRFR